MVISQKKDTKTSPASSKFKSKLTQKKTWNAKRELVKKRLMCLTQDMNNEEGPEDMDIPLICYKEKDNTTSGPTNCVGVSTSAVDRAQEVRENLSAEFPSFSKLMLRSHVTGGFWLSLPNKFCEEHLPKHDVTVWLMDENEETYNTKYLVNRNGLSGGWRGFSIAHELQDGDVLVFQLIEPCKFKVYIVRVSRLTEIDGAINLLTLDFHDKPIDEEIEDHTEETTQISDKVKENHHEPVLTSDYELATDQCGNTSDNSCSKIIQGIRFSESIINFRDVKKFEDFIIHVDGLIFDSEIPTHLRRKYYKLCCSQKMFLHEKLIEGLNCKLATGIISETINIADAIRAVNSTTSLNHVECWDRTLKAFEDLGMVVGFLRKWINKMLNVYRESEAVIEKKRIEREEAEVEMRSLEEKIGNVGVLVKRLDKEIDALTVKKEEQLGFVFAEVGDASW